MHGADRPRAVHLVTNIGIAVDRARAQVRSDWTVMQNTRWAKDRVGRRLSPDKIEREGRWLIHYPKIQRFITDQ